MRSPKEFVYRLRQEAANLWLLARKPVLAKSPGTSLRLLPDATPVVERLRGTPHGARIAELGDLILRHRIPLFDQICPIGPEIDWRRDYLHGKTSGLAYFRRIPYLNFEAVGDHKIVWELNRHQHLVILAQAFRLTGKQAFLEEIQRQLESWFAANPFLRGMNWTSALEVAFRALSWIWVCHLAAPWMQDAFRDRLLAELYRHGCYLEHNLSVYFSPNTHLQGEAVALHALGVLFPEFPQSTRWARLGRRIVREQLDFQVREDGSHFEQSSYYQVYALDLFLFHYILAGAPAEYRGKLKLMADYLAALMGPSRVLPFLGDDDGGRLMHPYGRRDHFGRATLAACALALEDAGWPYEPADVHEQAAWWLGEHGSPAGGAGPPPESRLFAQAGVGIMSAGECQVVIKAGPFGFGRGGHSHSDVLSVVARAGEEQLLVDAGTYSYSDAVWRNRFRGSAAHNTVRVDDLDQAIPATLFGWSSRPAVEIREWRPTAVHDFLDAACRYSGFVHRRRVLFLKPDRLFILDEIEGPEGEHLLEQFWHPGEMCTPLSATHFRIGRRACLAVAGLEAQLEEGGEFGWRSEVLGTKKPAPVIRGRLKSVLPACFAAVLDMSAVDACLSLSCRRGDWGAALSLTGERPVQVRFPRAGAPDLRTSDSIV